VRKGVEGLITRRGLHTGDRCASVRRESRAKERFVATVSLDKVSKTYPNGAPAVQDLDLEVAEES